MWMKIKIKNDNKNIYINAFFIVPKRTKEEVTGKVISSEHITHIVAKVDNVTVYEVYTSKYISENLLIKFKIKKHLYNKKIKFILTDNKGNVKYENFKIKNSIKVGKKTLLNSTKQTSFKKQKIWKLTTPKEAMKSFYGKTEGIENIIKVKVPELSENPFSIPINIQSDIDMKSIAIFENANPHSTVAIFSVPENGIIDYYLRMKMKMKCDTYITVVGEGINGKLYKTTKEIYLSGGDMNCDGTPNGVAQP